MKEPCSRDVFYDMPSYIPQSGIIEIFVVEIKNGISRFSQLHCLRMRIQSYGSVVVIDGLGPVAGTPVQHAPLHENTLAQRRVVAGSDKQLTISLDSGHGIPGGFVCLLDFFDGKCHVNSN